MAAPAHNNANALPPDTPVTIKVSVNDSLKKLKLPLRDLGANVLPDKLRHLLGIKPEQTVVFERFSDSAGGYIILDSTNPQVFKTLIRAAKAKLKLRLKATVSPPPEEIQQEESQEPEVAEEKATTKPMEPVIVRSPVYQNSSRDSTAFDRRSVGSGIFQFRDARASQQTLVDTSEAPVPRPFACTQKIINSNIAERSAPRELTFRNREPAATVSNHGHAWSVYCNECDSSMADAHFHCSICDGGDYDLCERCVASGKLCPGEGHWLIKRFIKDGKVINSTTERICPRKMKLEPAAEADTEKEMPGAFTEDTKTLAEEPREPTRTCNSCVIVCPERQFVTCKVCDDFDLCITCHTNNKHGHHPAHGFKPATEETTLSLAAEALLSPGRHIRHNAICDGCEKKIFGVRHKCLSCPDWDYCSDCIPRAGSTHPHHRFAAIYTPIADARMPYVRHFGIYCDGPMCNNVSEQSYITGIRYKCAVCHDTDFCASCEAHPSNPHNRTHPLIKFKTPVRNVSITTENEDLSGNMRYMGDQRGRPEPAQTETKSASTETTPVQQANAATQVQTVAEIKPTEEKQVVQPTTSQAQEQVSASDDILNAVLNAHFVKDSIPDGMVVQPGDRFTQVWTMRNPGPYAWPAGCSVRFVGGDNMLNVDNGHPAAVSDIANAQESNVVGRDVQIGEELAFKIVLKAPVREGKHISYWRMKSADGTPFGHRLWCDIEVKKPQQTPAEATRSAAPAFNTPFDASQQAQLSRMQAIRHQQMALMQHQQMLAQRQQQANAQYGQPPAYDANSSNNANISARIAAMREQQTKRREHMMAQYNAQREQLQAQGIKREDMPGWNQHFNPSIGSSSDTTEDEKTRKEAAKQRVEHIRAKILRAREEKSKLLEAQKELRDAASKAAAEKKTREEMEKVKKIIEEVTKNDAATEEKSEDVEGSQMVFPKLEKESPASSTYQSASSSTAGSKGKAAYVENEQGEIEREATPATAAVAAPEPVPVVTSPATEMDFEDLDDDLEVLSAAGEESEDDGFLTDEEYDILDASDQETVASK